MCRIDPARANDRNQDPACTQCPVNGIDKVHTRLDGLHITKDRHPGQMFLEMIREPPSSALAVLPAVTDENTLLHVGSGACVLPSVWHAIPSNSMRIQHVLMAPVQHMQCHTPSNAGHEVEALCPPKHTGD